MEIGIAKNGEARILSLKGNLRIQHWRVIDKHLDALLGQGARRVAVDLSGVTLICAAGLASLQLCARKFRSRKAELLVLAGTPYLKEAFRESGCAEELGNGYFTDPDSLERHLRSHAAA